MRHLNKSYLKEAPRVHQDYYILWPQLGSISDALAAREDAEVSNVPNWIRCGEDPIESDELVCVMQINVHTFAIENVLPCGFACRQGGLVSNNNVVCANVKLVGIYNFFRQIVYTYL